MRERPKGLRPNDTKVTNTTKIDLCEDAIEHITQEVHTQTKNDSLASLVTAGVLDTSPVVLFSDIRWTHK